MNSYKNYVSIGISLCFILLGCGCDSNRRHQTHKNEEHVQNRNEIFVLLEPSVSTISYYGASEALDVDNSVKTSLEKILADAKWTTKGINHAHVPDYQVRVKDASRDKRTIFIYRDVFQSEDNSDRPIYFRNKDWLEISPLDVELREQHGETGEEKVVR